jgi:GNAT superfamily N-acetyltransferase
LAAIRRATRLDIPRIGVLWALWVRSQDPGASPDLEAFEKYQEDIFNLPDFHYFVAEVDGKVVGFVNDFVSRVPSTGKTMGMSEQLYVLPEYRNTGVGGLLFRRIRESAKESGAEVLALQCRPEKQVFWEKKGFKVTRIVLEKEI